MNRIALMIVALTLSANAVAQMTAPPGVTTPTPGAAAPAPAPAAPAPNTPPPPPDPMTREFRECVRTSKAAMDAKGGQPDFKLIQDCLGAELKRHEAKMATMAASASKNLTPGEKKKLDEANSAWRRFRDANCGFYADATGGPQGSIENTDCLLNLTVGRAQEMEMLSVNAARRAEAKAKPPAK